MTEADVKAALIKVISQIQTNSALPCPPLDGATIPLSDVPQFDSKTGAAATAKLAKALGIDIPKSANIFVDTKTKTNLTIDETVALVIKIAKPKAKEAA